MKLHTILTAITLPALLWLSMACQGRFLPLTAVQGTTMAIPLAHPTLQDPSVAPIGYGGSALTEEDYQRGRLIYQLTDGVGGPLVLDANNQPIELETRVSGTIAFSRRAQQDGMVGSAVGAETLISIVDIPATAPVGGPFGLHVVNRRMEGGQVVETPWAVGQPQSEFEIVAGSGNPTPFESFFFGSWTDRTNLLPEVIPRPAVDFTVTTSCTLSECSNPKPTVAAVEFEIQYPASVIDVADVIPAVVTNKTLFWFEDDGLGLLQVAAVNPSAAVGQIYLVFTLDNGINQILDLTDLTVTVLKATDPDGVEINGDYEVNVNPIQIW